MVCLRNISVDTLHKGDTEDDDDENNNNNNNMPFGRCSRLEIPKPILHPNSPQPTLHQFTTTYTSRPCRLLLQPVFGSSSSLCRSVTTATALTNSTTAPLSLSPPLHSKLFSPTFRYCTFISIYLETLSSVSVQKF
jgi:hypothetical protein